MTSDSTMSGVESLERQLSIEEGNAIMRGGLGRFELELVTSFCTPLYCAIRDQNKTICSRNGTAFFLDAGNGLFGVTAAHVVEDLLLTRGEPSAQRLLHLARSPVAKADHRQREPEQLELPTGEGLFRTAKHQRSTALLQRGETEIANRALGAEESSQLRVGAHQSRRFDDAAQTERGGANAGELAPDGVGSTREEPSGERGQSPADRLGSGGGGAALNEGHFEWNGALEERECSRSELGAVMGADSKCCDLRQQLRSSRS